ncbi:MAG: hypothetical protein R6U36_10110 [Candidatus Fermentibacteraceae bacterium]
MIPRSLLTSAVLVLLLACSGDDGPAPSPQPELEPDPVARLPATLVGPEPTKCSKQYVQTVE